ncbi:MAG: hypothetical protein WA323_22505 [Candidatus Nitrosopolaris sp.]
MNQLSNHSIPSNNFYLPVIHAPMPTHKAVGFRWEFCDICLSGELDPIFSFDRLDSAVKADHICNSQALSKTQNRADISDFKKCSREQAISILKELSSNLLGSGPIFLTAEELQAPCSKPSLQYYVGKILPQYIFSKVPGPFYRQRVLSKDPYIDLGKVSNDHWAHRANRGQDGKTILKMEELLEFLNLAKSTFGAFQVELEDGMQHYLFLLSIFSYLLGYF